MPHRKGSLLKGASAYTGGFLQPFYPVHLLVLFAIAAVLGMAGVAVV